jgi:hypothetical protein
LSFDIEDSVLSISRARLASFAAQLPRPTADSRPADAFMQLGNLLGLLWQVSWQANFIVTSSPPRPWRRANRTSRRSEIDNIDSSSQVSNVHCGIFDVTGHLCARFPACVGCGNGPAGERQASGAVAGPADRGGTGLAEWRGWEYEVRSGADGVVLENIRFLAGYRRPGVVPAAQAGSAGM